MEEDMVDLVKDKEELRGISDEFVAKQIAHYAHNHPDFVEKHEKSESLEQFARSQEYKDMLKEVRSLLREVYGAFIMDKYEEMEKALETLREDQSVANHCKILQMHRSSKERLPFYERIYERIFNVTGTPGTVLDLACGLNPFSYPFLGCEPTYNASDISPVLCDYINEYFDMRQIDGEAFVSDLLEFNSVEHGESDVCFLFKTLDSLETLEWDFSEKLLKKIPADYLVVSFARHSLGGKEIADDRRSWFEDLLENENLEFEHFTVSNEAFYVVKK